MPMQPGNELGTVACPVCGRVLALEAKPNALDRVQALCNHGDARFNPVAVYETDKPGAVAAAVPSTAKPEVNKK